ERHEGELTNQLVGVVAHSAPSLSARARMTRAAARRRTHLVAIRHLAVLRGDAGRRALEVLVRRAVVAVRKRRALARLPFARRRVTACDAALERAGFDLLLDELDRRAHTFGHRPRDLRLHGDWEVAANVLEEGTIRLREVVRIGGEPLHRPLARREHLAAVVELRRTVHVRVDEILDRAVDRS